VCVEMHHRDDEQCIVYQRRVLSRKQARVRHNKQKTADAHQVKGPTRTRTCQPDGAETGDLIFKVPNYI
jgi:hypothetical protein